MPRGSRPFHGGRGSVDYDDAELFSGDPRVAPGLPRPIGWRVRSGDGSSAYDKYGPLDTNWVPIGTSAAVGITSINSPDSSILVGNPTGPAVTVETNPATSTATLFDLVLSYGHGMAADAELPAATSFWFSPTTIADLARANQVREWVTTDALAFLELVIRVDAATLTTAAGRYIVTVNGLDTAIGLDLPLGATADTTLRTSALFTVAADSRVGVRFNGSAIGAGSSMRAEIRLRGATSGTPIVPNTLPANALALFPPENLALDGNTWTDAVAGHTYTCTVPTPSGPPPPGIDQISGPARMNDGKFNGHPYAYFRNYNGAFDGINYTPCMLSTSVAMFAGSAAPIAPRTYVAVCRPDTGIGGVAMSGQRGTPCFEAALYQPAGDLTQAVYFNVGKGTAPTDNLATPHSYATQEVILIWRTDGTVVEFFINGVKQVLDATTIGADNAAAKGFGIGNLPNAEFSSRVGFRGGICFEGVWAHNFTDAEVLQATSNCAQYVTP
jgi:hypothetical protein